MTLIDFASFRTQWMILATLLLTILVAIGWNALSDHTQTEAQEQARLLSRARMIGVNLSQQLSASKKVLMTLRSEAALWNLEATLDDHVSDKLTLVTSAMPSIRTINILDRRGKAIASNRSELFGQSFAMRDYFKQARHLGSDQEVLLSEPFQTALGVHSMNLVMAMQDRNRQFAGAVTMTLAPEYFNTLLDSVRYAPDVRAAIIHEGGQLFTQVPAVISPGKNVDQPDSFFRTHKLSGQSENSYAGLTATTREKRLLALLTIRRPDLNLTPSLTIVTSRAYHAVFAAWERDLVAALLSWSLLAATAVALLTLFQGYRRILDSKLARTRASLDESESRFHQLIASAPNAMLMVNGEGKISMSNPAAEQLLGYAPGGLSHLSLADLIPERHRADHAGFHRYFMTTRQSRAMGQGRELFALKQDGTECPVEVSLNSLEIAGQTVVLATLVDISTRTRIRMAMEKLAYLNPELEVFDAIAEAIHIGLRARWCGIGRLTDNGEQVDLLGFWDTHGPGAKLRYAIRGTPCERSCTHTDHLVIEDHVAAAYPDDHLLGEIGAASYRGAPIFDEHNRMIGIVFAVDDHPCQDDPIERVFLSLAAKRVSSELSRQDALANLRASEDRFRQLAENIYEVFWVSDVEKQSVIYISPAYECIWGRSCEELYADPQSWIDAIHPEDRERVKNNALTQQALGTYDETYRITRTDGATIWIRDRAFPVRDADGKIIRIVGIAEDITAHKNAEQAHERLQAQLRQAQKMEAIGQLTGGIAHDFNNILASVLGYTSLSLDRFQDSLPEKVREYLMSIQQAGERARDLVAKMLAYARETSGTPQVLDPLVQVNSAIKMLAPTLPASVEVILEADQHLPAIKVDPVQFHQVVTNLIINARDAIGEQGQVKIELRLAGTHGAMCDACHEVFTGVFVAIIVFDDGAGIEPQHLNRIFDPFFTTKSTGKGTGLGLSMVHGIVHDHGGHILVNSLPGHHTTFRALFPLAEARPVSESEAPDLHEHHRPKRNLRIMVVDDEPGITRYLVDLLELHGHTVTPFNDPRAAWKHFESNEHEVDLVISDQTMPHMTGADLASWMLAKRSELPIILCTGHSEFVTPESASTLGIRRFFYKPVASADLLSAIREIA